MKIDLSDWWYMKDAASTARAILVLRAGGEVEITAEEMDAAWVGKPALQFDQRPDIGFGRIVSIRAWNTRK